MNNLSNWFKEEKKSIIRGTRRTEGDAEKLYWEKIFGDEVK
jgi:hypothetical protein